MKRFNKKIARQILQDNPDYDWVAQDEDGEVKIFSRKPERKNNYYRLYQDTRIISLYKLNKKGFKKAIYSREELFPCDCCENVINLENNYQNKVDYVIQLESTLRDRIKSIKELETKLEPKEPTVEVGDYFITLSRPVKRCIVRSNPHDTSSLKLICIDEYETHTKTKDIIIHLIKSGELRKFKNGEVIKIEV